MNDATALVWLRRDLRLEDNPALSYACKNYQKIVVTYIHHDLQDWTPGAASLWWLAGSLASFETSLKERKSRLCLVAGDPFKMLSELCQFYQARAVVWNRQYEPAAIARDKKIKAQLSQNDIEVKSFNATMLLEPWEIKTKGGTPYKVFTPFWRAVKPKLRELTSLNAPKTIASPTKKFPGETTIGSLKLRPSIAWDKDFYPMWAPGESGAKTVLREFLKNRAARYQEQRDLPAVNGTSTLSPHLHFGEISPRQVLAAVQKKTKGPSDENLIEGFLRQIAWREFSYYLLYHFPYSSDKPLVEKYQSFPWRRDKKKLTAWQKGETGYPLVDAGMRQLWRTGWMHNRVRMICASFLVKHLGVHWLNGAAWFWDTLVDADLANNTMGWQWVAGCGADAAPYYRIFNPVSQGQRFDAKAAYISQWVPEVKALPAKLIHSPWQASDHELKAAGVRLGKDYPRPIVNHMEARQRALNDYELFSKKKAESSTR